MRIQCPHCGAGGELDDSKRPAGVTSIKCPRCSQSFPLPPVNSVSVPEPPPLRPCPSCGGVIEGDTPFCNSCDTVNKKNGGIPPSVHAAPPPLPPLEGFCAICKEHFPQDEMIRFDRNLVCASCKPRYLQMVSQGIPNPGGLHLAGFWIRFGAKMIDGLILGAALVIAVILMVLTAKSAGMGNEVMFAAIIVGYILFFAVGLTYNVYFIGKHGATPGKMVCGLKVVNPEGGMITYGRATGRAFAEMLNQVIPLYIGYILMVFDSEKRTIHDMICNTRVVYK